MQPYTDLCAECSGVGNSMEISGFDVRGLINPLGRSQWPRGLRHGSAAARLVGLRVRIPQGHGCLSIVSVVSCQVEVSASG